MSEKWYTKFVIRKFNKLLFESKLPLESIFYKLKSEYSFNDICIVVDNLNSKFDKYIYGNPFPRKISDFDKDPIVFRATEIEKEINWLYLSVRKYGDQLNEIIGIKNKIEKLILSGDYENALLQIKNLNNIYGTSLWSIEIELIIAELTGGVDNNKALLGEINSNTGTHPYVLCIIDYLSKKAELDFPVNRYLNELKITTDTFDDDDFKTFSIEYYLVKVAHLSKRGIQTSRWQLSYSASYSLIDRYLTFIKVIQDYICFHSPNDDEVSMLDSRLFYIAKKIHDPVLEKMRIHINPGLNFKISDVDKNSIHSIDLYTKGEYLKSSTSIKALLSNEPRHFNLLILYLKTLINLGKPYEPVLSGNSLIDKISKEAYEVLIRKNNPQVHFRNLTKYAFILSSFPIATQILDFALSEVRNDKSNSYISSLNSSFYNPKIARHFSNKENGNKYLLNLDSKLNVDSNTIKFLFCVINEELEYGLNNVEISDERKKVYSAQYYQATGKHHRAIDLWSELLEDSKDRYHLHESILAGLYHSHFSLGNIDECIDLYVDTYIQNKHLTIKFDPSIVQTWIRKNRFKGIIISIKLPIFFYLTNQNESRISIALEKFLAENNSKTVKEFIENHQDLDKKFNKELLIIFLRSVSSVEVFKHMVHIKGTKNKILERIFICEYLIKLDPKNKEEYKDENEELNRQLLLQEGLQEYDESKIYINEKMIRNTQLDEIEIDYLRFEQFEEILKKNPNLKVLIGDTLFNVKKSTKEEDQGEPIFSQDPSFDLFKTIFKEVRDKFLFSKYGLAEYLSARIRHGVFKSEIRPKFDKLNLVTEKNAETSKYKANHYWSENIITSESNQNKLQEALSLFSGSVDQIIEEEALQKFLQIKTELRNPEGWFDYTFDDTVLSLLYVAYNKMEVSNFQVFIDFAFKTLWYRTDKNLDDIKVNLKSKIGERFNQVISNLESTILEILSPSERSDLMERITTSKVYIQNDIDRITGWFNRSGRMAKDFNINKIIEISHQHSNRGFKQQILLKRNINCDLIFKGEFYSNFIDLFRIFFDNALEYCGVDKGSVTTEVDIVMQDDYLLVRVQNELIGDTDQIKERVQRYQFDERKSSTEGKSGFPKAMKILKSYLGNPSNCFDFKVNDNNKFEVNASISTKNLVA